MYIKRNCESMILELAKSFPCIIVYGSPSGWKIHDS